ncbi:MULTISPECIES: DUF6282 family protein [Micromonospora]|uniref:Cytosolic protein n=1 Tax=Micromonospora sicca TaxID=2202420 RepID=A0A317DL08_9ACTN|nr:MULTISPECIES: DUF6282 family protein [unclassified Micromonospora]MBM0224636.1 hypothetical protein [Micromonospora sp. ATA51]PWR15449.1 hypothetical protein DKT69_10765 [Micromonospora sp. 4G51]
MFDVHVHAAPDVLERIGYDDQIGDSYAAAGYSGFVLKAHHESTVGRASALSRSSGLEVVGGIALNRAVGGINPAAVLSALSTGGRVVWFPTADAHTQESAHLPRLADLDERLDRSVLSVPPVLAPDDEAAKDVALVLDLIAEHDAVLCTGHLSGEECRWLLEQALNRGISRFLLTHPSYTVPAMKVQEIAELADKGAHVEITAYQLFHQPGMTASKLAAVAQAAGSRLVLASDAGQPDSPEPPSALEQLIAALSAQGLDPGWLQDAASDTPSELVLP